MKLSSPGAGGGASGPGAAGGPPLLPPRPRPCPGSSSLSSVGFSLRNDIEQALGGIHGRAAPIGSAIVAGRRNRSAQAGRRKQSLIARILQQFADRRLLRFRRVRIDVLLGEGLPRERRRLGREGLGRGTPLARNVGLRHGPLFDGPQRLARDAVEHVEEAELGRLRDGVDVLAVMLHGEQLGSGGKIVIP